jgi:hypothetical protein
MPQFDRTLCHHCQDNRKNQNPNHKNPNPKAEVEIRQKRQRHLLRMDSGIIFAGHGTSSKTRHPHNRPTVPLARHGTSSRSRYLQEEVTVPSATVGSKHYRAATQIHHKGQSRRGPRQTWERSVQQRERSAVSLAQQSHQLKFPTSTRIQ